MIPALLADKNRKFIYVEQVCELFMFLICDDSRLCCVWLLRNGREGEVDGTNMLNL